MTKFAPGCSPSKASKRRQTERGEKNGITIIDDFGHHPTAIRVTLQGLRQRYPDRRLWAVFEPRSNTSRRKVLQEELVNALKEADGSIIAAINAHREGPRRAAPRSPSSRC